LWAESVVNDYTTGRDFINKGVYMGEGKEIKDRLRNLRKALDMTQQEFANQLKLKSGNTLSMIERGESTLTDQNIELICTPNRLKAGRTVNEAWLRHGGDDKDMFKAPPPDNDRPRLYENNQELPIEEEELIGIYRKLEPPNKKAVRATADALLDTQDGAEKGERGSRRADTSKKSG
jgi:transcriptional regulator with XRE-family HTH domain